MYNNPLKVPILQEVSYCTYPPSMKDYIVNAVIESIGFPYKEQQPKYMRKKVGNDTIIMESSNSESYTIDGGSGADIIYIKVIPFA